MYLIEIFRLSMQSKFNDQPTKNTSSEQGQSPDPLGKTLKILFSFVSNEAWSTLATSQTGRRKCTMKMQREVHRKMGSMSILTIKLNMHIYSVCVLHTYTVTNENYVSKDFRCIRQYETRIGVKDNLPHDIQISVISQAFTIWSNHIFSRWSGAFNLRSQIQTRSA